MKQGTGGKQGTMQGLREDQTWVRKSMLSTPIPCEQLRGPRLLPTQASPYHCKEVTIHCWENEPNGLIQGLGKREKGPMSGFRCPFRGTSELQMQVFTRTAIGVPSYFMSPWGEEWGPPVSEPSAKLVKPQTPLVMGMGCRGCKLSKPSQGILSTHQLGTLLGF